MNNLLITNNFICIMMIQSEMTSIFKLKASHDLTRLRQLLSTSIILLFLLTPSPIDMLSFYTKFDNLNYISLIIFYFSYPLLPFFNKTWNSLKKLFVKILSICNQRLILSDDSIQIKRRWQIFFSSNEIAAPSRRFSAHLEIS